MAEARQLAPFILQHAAAALARQLACSKLEQPPTESALCWHIPGFDLPKHHLPAGAQWPHVTSSLMLTI